VADPRPQADAPSGPRFSCDGKGRTRGQRGRGRPPHRSFGANSDQHTEAFVFNRRPPLSSTKGKLAYRLAQPGRAGIRLGMPLRRDSIPVPRIRSQMPRRFITYLRTTVPPLLVLVADQRKVGVGRDRAPRRAVIPSKPDRVTSMSGKASRSWRRLLPDPISKIQEYRAVAGQDRDWPHRPRFLEPRSFANFFETRLIFCLTIAHDGFLDMGGSNNRGFECRYTTP